MLFCTYPSYITWYTNWSASSRKGKGALVDPSSGLVTCFSLLLSSSVASTIFFRVTSCHDPSSGSRASRISPNLYFAPSCTAAMSISSSSDFSSDGWRENYLSETKAVCSKPTIHICTVLESCIGNQWSLYIKRSRRMVWPILNMHIPPYFLCLSDCFYQSRHQLNSWVEKEQIF